VSTKVNGETRERLEQIAKRSAAVRGQARRGATVADACRVRPGRTSGFSDCQVLWLIAGRSVSRAAVCALLPYVRDPSACQGLWKIADRSAYAKRLGERGRGVGLGLSTSSIVKSVLHRTRSKRLELGPSLIVESLLHGKTSKRLGHRASLIVKSQSLAWDKLQETGTQSFFDRVESVSCMGQAPRIWNTELLCW